MRGMYEREEKQRQGEERGGEVKRLSPGAHSVTNVTDRRSEFGCRRSERGRETETGGGSQKGTWGGKTD